MLALIGPGPPLVLLVVLGVACTDSSSNRRGTNLPPIDATDRVILFGDLHTHTTISLDAAIRNLPVQGGAGFYQFGLQLIAMVTAGQYPELGPVTF